MSDRMMTRRPRSPSAARIERLEDRRLWSAAGFPIPVAAAVHHPAAERVVRHVRPADDDDPGDAGDAGSADNGGSDDNGVAATSPGSSAGGSTDVSPPASDGAADSGGSSTGTAPTTDDSGDAAGGDTSGGTAVDDGTDPTILYPTGDPYDDSLYDDGGTTVVVLGSAGAADFGGAVHVRLPPHPVAGDAGTATVDVFNTGGRADGRMELAVGVSPDGSAADSIPVADEQVPVHLGHDRVAAYRVPFVLPATLPAGTYRFLALVDAGNAFAETDEANNLAVGPAVAIAAAVPDLSVATVTAAPRLRVGHPATVTVHLAEAGTIDESGSTTITVTAAPAAGGASQLLATVTRPAQVGRGRPVAEAVRFTVPALPAGRYRLTVRVTPVSAADADAADKSAAATTTVFA